MDTSLLLGQKVINTQTRAIGVIEKIENGLVCVLTHGNIIKYEYPTCFTNILELEDENLQPMLESEYSGSSFKAFKNIYEAAVLQEINYLKSTGGNKYRAVDGELIPSKNAEYVYAFDTDTDLHFPDGTAVKIWMPDRIVVAYVVSCEEFTIVLRSMESLGTSVEMIEFTAEQWHLLEALTERIEEMNPRSESIAYEIACKGRNQINKHRSILCGQNFAYSKATSENITFIWGPPGTGKTETLANIALDHIGQGNRVLMVSYSNVSVDGALLRVAHKQDFAKGTILRYGYPRAKELLEDNKDLTSYQCALNKNPMLAAEFQELNAQKKKLKRKDPERVAINKKLAKIREKILEQEQILVQNAMFVATTVSKAIVDRTIYSQRFDVVIFDEASMAYVPQVIFAAGLCKKHFICLGDFCQLPAIVQSNDNERLTEDIFSYIRVPEAVRNDWGHNWLVMLNIQYRMHRDIATIVNRYMYEDKLETTDEIFDSRNDIAACEPMSGEPVSMVDLSYTYSVCTKTMDGSRINLLSALICLRIAEMFIDKYEVGIITPYSAQSRLILAMIRDMRARDERYSQITCATVHQFQGSEKPVIIYDAVDCFRMPYPGVLLTGLKNDTANRLFNVALTRTKGKFILVANQDYLFRKNISKKLIFTNVLNDIKRSKAFIDGDDLIDTLGSEVFDGTKAIYFGSREESLTQYYSDLENATKKITIEIPGMIAEDDEAIDAITEILDNKVKAGIDISIRIGEGIVLPEGFQKYASYKGYVTTPMTIIDRSVIWFGQPIAAADFISENEILETKYFPCARFYGAIAARALQAFYEL